MDMHRREWDNTDWTKGRDDDAFLFVIRPVEKRTIFRRARDENGTLIEEYGLLFHSGDAFNFGHNTFFWGNRATTSRERREIWAFPFSRNTYFTDGSTKTMVGQIPAESGKLAHWKECEVFQLI